MASIEPDYDISEFLSGDADVIAGVDDINDHIDLYLDGEYNSEAVLDLITGGVQKAPKEVIDTPESQTFSPEPELPVDIDETITTGDMLALIRAEIQLRGIAGHHIESMNTFMQTGIKQIVRDVFTVDGRIKNQRDKTPEDKEISDIHFKVNFTDVRMTPPTTTKYKSGSVQLLTPNMARLKNLTYSCPMYIDAEMTATAVYKNGTTQTKEWKLLNHRTGSIPCMVRTDICVTHNAPLETLKEIEEDPYDDGGYFIIKGGEWTIDNLENLTNNTYHVYKQHYMNEIVRGTFLSKAGDAFENSYYIVIRYLTNGAITVELTMGRAEKFEIPFYLLFRALGMTSDKQIANHIVYGVENTDPITKRMLEILEKAFTVADSKFEKIKDSTNSIDIINFIAKRMTDTMANQAAGKDENIIKYLNGTVLFTFDTKFLPHIGTRPEHRIRKLRFMGHLINKLLRVDQGVLDSTDRDSYRNKRVHAAGTSLAKTFKTDFNFAIVQEIKKRIMRDYKMTTFSSVNLVDSVKMAIKADDLERMLTQGITTGNKTITVKRNEITNRLSSQQLYHKNDLNVKSTLNTINTPNIGNASKQNERADEMRRVHGTYVGYIDPTQSNDSGEKVGMTKQKACTASVSGASSSSVLKRILYEDPDIMSLDNVAPEQITSEKLAKVFVNGDWIGCCRDSYNLTSKYRAMRRWDRIHYQTTVVWEPLVREVLFWTDVGRLLRPLVIVYNNRDEYITAMRSGKRIEFKQWVKLRRDHILGLNAGTLTMDDLRRERIIEYIAPEEQENAFIVPNIDGLRIHANDITYMFTHCDIDQAILGLVSLASPMANHSSTARITMYTNHRKQSAGWFTLNWPYRIDKNTTLQYYCERPLVSTFTDSLTYPNGHNCIVALALHGGQNQEDSILLNKSSVDCGMHNASHFNNEKAKLEKGEQFGNPDFARTMETKKDAIYEYIENGFIKEGTIAKKGYVLIVKVAKLSKPVEQYLYIDKSIEYKHDEPVFIERVITPRNDEDALIAKVKLRAVRPLGIGDKLCLTPDHDVLTTRGWVPIANVTLGDSVATINERGGLEYNKPIEIHEYEHNDEVYEIESRQISQKVTKNHRMYVNIGKGDFQLLPAEFIYGKKVQYKKNAVWDAPCTDVIDLEYGGQVLSIKMDPWLALLGIFLSSGISQSGRIEINKQNSLFLQVCNQLDIGYTLNDAGDTYYINNTIIAGVLQSLYPNPYDRYLPDYVFALGSLQATNLLLGLKNNNDECYTSSVRLCDDIMRLALHCNISANFERVYGSYKIKFVKKNEPTVGYSRYERYVHYTGKVHCITVPNGVFYVRRNGKPCWTGNSSRTGNKGIVASVVDRIDMPVCENGLIPDIIVNAHSIPTRMAVNQIIECVMAQLAVEKGCLLDATTFRKIDLDGMLAELETYGIKYGGHQRMYNGRTGDWLDVAIFVGPTTYQRLQKFVIDEHYSIRRGPTAPLTRQPLDGKQRDGGLRIGEMESWCFTSHGAMRALYEKFYINSDGVNIPICRICGNRAIVNEKEGIYICKYCEDSADIAEVSSSWVANLFFNEASAMNIKMKFDLEPYEYLKYEE